MFSGFIFVAIGLIWARNAVDALTGFLLYTTRCARAMGFINPSLLYRAWGGRGLVWVSVVGQSLLNTGVRVALLGQNVLKKRHFHFFRHFFRHFPRHFLPAYLPGGFLIQ